MVDFLRRLPEVWLWSGRIPLQSSCDKNGIKNMEFLRMVFSMVSFITGVHLVFDIFSNGFNTYVLAGIIFAFYLAHIVWPKERDRDEDFSILDLVEFFIQLPYQSVAMVLRGIGRAFRDNDGVDVDL